MIEREQIPELTDPDRLWVPLRRVMEWGERRRAYDLAHPLGEHEAGGFSNRPAFHADLLPMQGRRPEQTHYAANVVAWCFCLLFGGAIVATFVRFGILVWFPK